MKSENHLILLVITVLVLTGGQNVGGQESSVRWIQTRTLPAPEAHQAAAAQGEHVYAISSRMIAKYGRHSGKRVAVSTGKAKHLNSGIFWKSRLYCAHSNYPSKPERSQIMVLDPETMRLSVFKNFGDSGGSLTWILRRDGHWWGNFAHYGNDNARTFLVKYDDDWNELARWTYPASVISQLGHYSLSGGIWNGNDLLVTGHDDPVLFQLRLPKSGTVLEFIGQQTAPFSGQGVALDPTTGGLIGIHRAKRQLVFARSEVSAAQPQEDGLASARPARTSPNIVIILADDMGNGDVGILNDDSGIPTPNLDRLAKEGLIFTDAHSAGSYCVPSRYGLLTGRYMWRTRLGSGGNLANLAGTLIEPGRKTIANVLQNAGYFTGLIGKWHQGIDWNLHDESERGNIRTNRNYQNFQNIDFGLPALKGPKDFGFDYSFGTAGSAEMNPAAFIENNRVTVLPSRSSEQSRKKNGEWYGRDDNIVAEGYTMERLVPTLSDKACEFVETATRTRPKQPFFLYYALTTPHNPIIPNTEFVGKSRAGAYGDFVVELDHHVGRLLRKLSKLGVEKNTIVLFTSDNGPVNRTKGYWQKWVRGDTAIHGHDSTGPFNGWKGGLQEGGHRVPFFVRWPEKIKAGERCRTTINFIDILPTMADLLNLELDSKTAEDGQSFFQALTGGSRPESFHKAMVHNQNNGKFAIRKGAFKLTVNGPKTIAQVLDDTFPVSLALHDLDKDVGEIIDVSGTYPERVKEMHALLKEYVRQGRSN